MCLSHFIYTVRPCLIHPCHAAPMPSPTMPFFSRPRHSTTVERLLARVRLLPATTRSSTKLLSDAYQSQMQVASVKPNTVCMDEEKSGSSTLQKRLSRTSSRIFPATIQTFTKDTALSEQGRGAAWHVWINARHGRGTAWARHAMCESALRWRMSSSGGTVGDTRKPWHPPVTLPTTCPTRTF